MLTKKGSLVRGQFVEIVDTSVGDSLQQLLQERFDFTADLTHFPIAGLCAKCAKKGVSTADVTPLTIERAIEERVFTPHPTASTGESVS